MAFVRTIMVALVLAGTVWGTHPYESARDQYAPREDSSHPPTTLPNEATDHPSEVHMVYQKNFMKKLTDLNNKAGQVKTPELQVGCADGLIKEELEKTPSETNKNRRNRRDTKRKTKRSYTLYTGSRIDFQPNFQSISVWKPPVYQLSRPYYIPIFGIPGRLPIYFPPQQFVMKPIEPPFQGPTYLPPTTSKPSETTMSLGDRFGDEDEGRPVWGGDSMENNAPTKKPPQTTTSRVIPTRRPNRPGNPPNTYPPLVHDTNNTSSSGDQTNSNIVPRPPSFDSPPVQQTARPPQQTGPSSCVWAIISCCSFSGEIPYNCFDQRGCPGAFWDNNPCTSEFANAAIASAVNYYDRNKR